MARRSTKKDFILARLKNGAAPSAVWKEARVHFPYCPWSYVRTVAWKERRRAEGLADGGEQGIAAGDDTP